MILAAGVVEEYDRATRIEDERALGSVEGRETNDRAMKKEEEDEGEDELNRRRANRLAPAMGSTISSERVGRKGRGDPEVAVKVDADGLSAKRES